MTINVSDAIDSDTARVITVTRSAVGVYDTEGDYVPGATSTFTALASPQQPTPQQLLAMPEGERSNDIRLFICNKLLRVTKDEDGTTADIISFEGRSYKVTALFDWDSFGFCKALGVLIK